MANAATGIFSGQRNYHIPRHPRYRPKVPHPHIRPPRIHILLLFLVFAILLWNRHADMMSTISSWTPGDSHSPFAYGTVRVDNVIEFDGDSNHIDETARDENGDGDESGAIPSQLQPGDQVNRVDSNLLKDDTVDRSQAATDSEATDSEATSSETAVRETADREAADNTADHGEAVSEESSIHAENDADASGAEPSLDSAAKETTQQQELEQSEKERVDLKTFLNFTDRTAINFMHFHKTGGVSFKTALHKFYNNKMKSNGRVVLIRDACYAREGVKQDGQPSFQVWRCDWEPLREQSEEERNRHDFVFGHQFRGKGVDELLNRRDLRTFTVLRHPFDRKVSFFYHFFVREVGRKEEDISFGEIRDFLLYDKLRIEADLGRDLGPNYMAGRLLSDGMQGYEGNKSYSIYAIGDTERAEVVERALQVIRNYVFVGLQSQSEASQCMLRKVMEEFNAVNGVNNEGIEEVDKGGMRLNSGSYSLSAKVIWSRLSAEERAHFDHKEGVDLSIFREGKRLFRKHVDIFRCSDRLTEDE
eukprot:GFKZ01000662.1.p1 GENE.GFKZ01000662.1~~GFKZ01000662.1.p1  ORF type:complete len:533 (+),score=93.30 GFKZ01000662.1:215-1813(+)